MKRYLIAYGLAGLVFLPLDFIWLRTVGQTFYRGQLGDILADAFRPGPAVAFYLLYLIGVAIFALQPAFAAASWRTALLYGALFGFFAYATYDLTNMATLRHWSWSVTVIDILWGAFLTGVSASLAFWLTATFIDPD